MVIIFACHVNDASSILVQDSKEPNKIDYLINAVSKPPGFRACFNFNDLFFYPGALCGAPNSLQNYYVKDFDYPTRLMKKTTISPQRIVNYVEHLKAAPIEEKVGAALGATSVVSLNLLLARKSVPGFLVFNAALFLANISINSNFDQ